MECVAHVKCLHQKCANGYICGETEKCAVPFFVGDINVVEHQKRYGKGSGQTVVQKPRDGGQIKEGKVLVKERGLNHSGNAAKQTKQPGEMKNIIVFLSKQNAQGHYQTGHAANAVGNDAVPPDLTVSKYLGQSDCDDSHQKQSRYNLQADFLRAFRNCMLFTKKQTGGGT